MNSNAREEYLIQEVHTATPQKLKLMLLEAAIRFGERTKMLWQSGQYDQAIDTIQRCQNIVAEILSGLTPSRGTELGQRLSGIYLFVFRTLVEAGRTRNEHQLNDALRVLQIERDTWREVVETYGKANSTKPPHFDMERASSFSLEG